MERIGSSVRKSRIGLFGKPPVYALPAIVTPPRIAVKAASLMEEESPLPPMEEDAVEEEASVVTVRNVEMLVSKAAKEEESKKKEVSLPPPIRWRKGELIGCGAFGRVYMGMNLDSGELLAVKEVDIVDLFLCILKYFIPYLAEKRESLLEFWCKISINLKVAKYN